MTDNEDKNKVGARAYPDGTRAMTNQEFKKALDEIVRTHGPVLQMLADYDAMDD